MQVYEKRSDPRTRAAAGGRSINLALSRRGWKALEAAGVDHQVRQQAIAMRGRMIHNSEGNTALQPYGTDGQAIYSVSRGTLNQLLLNKAERHGVQLFFEHPCQSVDMERGQPPDSRPAAESADQPRCRPADRGRRGPTLPCAEPCR